MKKKNLKRKRNPPPHLLPYLNEVIGMAYHLLKYCYFLTAASLLTLNSIFLVLYILVFKSSIRSKITQLVP